MSGTAIKSKGSIKTISDEGISIIRARGDLALLEGGVRKILKSSFMPAGSYGSQEAIDIPEMLHSRETFKFFQFSEQKADQLWDMFHHTDPDHNPGHENPWVFTRAYINLWSGVADAYGKEGNYEVAFRAIGMQQAFIDRVMDPDWFDMLPAVSAKECALEIIELRWDLLCSIDFAIKRIAGHQAR